MSSELVISSSNPHPVAVRFWKDRNRDAFVAHFLAYDFQEKKSYVLRDLIFDRIDRGGLLPEPTLTFDAQLNINGLQEMMNDLWRAGIRPTDLNADAMASERDYLRVLLDKVLPSALRNGHGD